MKKTINIFFSFLIFSMSIHAETFEKISLDAMHNVHVTTSSGKNIQLMNTNNASDPKLSPDGKTAVWLINFAQASEENMATELVIYRKGKMHSIQCAPLIRDYWFWRAGSHVAIDCGGMHFAGREILYSVSTLKKISEFDQHDIPIKKRPAWSRYND